MWILLLFVFSLYAGEEALTDIRQLTFTEMGFEKAGEAYFSPDERSIIFQAVPWGKSHYQMYVMDLEEGVPRMVSTGKGACTCGFFHPKEKKILFASSHESPLELEEPSEGRYKWNLTPYMNIYQANLDGTDLEPLTSGPAYHAECAFSPDGEQIVYASDEDGSMNLYVMRSDGSDVRQLTHTTHCYNGGSFFSPDGKSIVFRADRDLPHYLQLYTIQADGSDERPITQNDEVNWAPYWHPDGRHIAYTRSLDNHRRYEIFLLDTKSGQEMRVTDSATFDGLPVFNSDGTKLMWTSKRSGTCQIFLANFRM